MIRWCTIFLQVIIILNNFKLEKILPSQYHINKFTIDLATSKFTKCGPYQCEM